jgi:hypothetical protein
MWRFFHKRVTFNTLADFGGLLIFWPSGGIGDFLFVILRDLFCLSMTVDARLAQDVPQSSLTQALRGRNIAAARVRNQPGSTVESYPC